MNKRIQYLLALLVFAHASTQAQETCLLSITGKVTDQKGASLPGATLVLMPGAVGVVTDENGAYAFTHVCRGVVTLMVQYVGYKSVYDTIAMSNDVVRNYKLHEDSRVLREVVVNEVHENTAHAYNLSVLDEKQLEASAGKSLGETIREVPGVNTIQAGPGIFKPVIHGVHSQRVLILNYGIRQEGQQWGAEHAPEIDPFIASNIVVIKDASAIKYGTDALGGVIIVNPAPLPESNKLGGTLQTVVQSNGRSGVLSGMLEGGIGNHDGWGWRMQGTMKRTGDFHTPDYSLTNTGVQEANFSLSTGYHSEHVGVEVFFSHFQSTLGILKGTSISNVDDLLAAMESEPPLQTADFSYHIGAPRQEVSHDLLKLNGHINTEAGTWRAQYGLQRNARREYDIRRGSLSSIPAIDLMLLTHTLELEREQRLDDALTLCIGATGLWQDNHNVPGTQRIPFIPDFTSTSTGAYAIAQRKGEHAMFDLGVRYDYRHSRVAGYDFKNSLFRGNLNFHNVSASAGARMQLKSNAQFATNLGFAWRPPHVAELYSLGTHQSAAAIEFGLLLNDSTNEVMDLDAVNFSNEQALKWVNTYTRHWSNLDVDVTAYANMIFNYIYLQPKGVTETVRGVFPYFRYTQTNALFLGTDLAATWHPGARVDVMAKASLLRASDVTHNDYLVFIPSNRYELGVKYAAPAAFKPAGLFVELKTRYVDKQRRAPRVITVRELKEAQEAGTDPLQGSELNFDFAPSPAAYALVSLSAGCSIQPGRARYDFRVSVDNVFNTAYREYTNRFRYYADELGRNFTFSIKRIF